MYMYTTCMLFIFGHLTPLTDFIGVFIPQIWWLTDVGKEAPANFTPVAQSYYYPSDELHSNNVSVLNVMFNALSSDNIQ